MWKIMVMALPIVLLIFLLIKKVDSLKIIVLSMLFSVPCGLIVDSQIEGHPHVPFSDFMATIFVVVMTFCIVLITLLIRYFMVKNKKY